MPGTGASDEAHACKIDGVLDWRNNQVTDKDLEDFLAFKLVRPANIFCNMLIKTWPRGAAIKAPYAAILGTLDVK